MTRGLRLPDRSEASAARDARYRRGWGIAALLPVVAIAVAWVSGLGSSSPASEAAPPEVASA